MSLLVGNKAIAFYVGVYPREVKRWVEEYGLPARRFGDRLWRTTTEEVDDWIRSIPPGDHRPCVNSDVKKN